MAGPLLGSKRRLEGPLGKADRSIAFAILAVLIATSGGKTSDYVSIVVPVLCAGLFITIWNRLRFALAEPCEEKVLASLAPEDDRHSSVQSGLFLIWLRHA